MDPATDQPKPKVIGLTADAHEAWVQFYNDHANTMAGLRGDLAAAWSKIEGYAARLALIIHLARWAALDRSIGDRVDARCVQAAIVLARWFANEARRVYAVLGESEERRNRRELMELIAARGGSITVRELTRASRRYSDTGQAERALQHLVKAKVAVAETSTPAEQGGRPTTVFRLVDVASGTCQLGN